jgi:ATP-binding cassette subfamily C protein LapB
MASLLRCSRGLTAAHLLLATLLITLLGLALPIMLLQVYDRILPNAALGTLSVLFIGVAVALTLETALRLVRGEVLGRLAARADMELHSAAMTRMLEAPSSAFCARGHGWYSERLHAIGGLREAWSSPALQALLDLPFAGIYLFLIWSVAGPLVLAPLTILGVVLLTALLNGGRVRRRARALADVEEQRVNFLFDVLRGFQTIKLLGAEALLERRYERLQGAAALNRRKLTDATAATQDMGLMLAQLSTLIVAAWGALLVIDGALTVGGLGASVMLAGRCIQPVVGGAALWSRLQAVADRADRVAEIEALAPEARPNLPPLRTSAGRINLSGVRHGPRVDGGWLLENLSLEVGGGELVGVIGQNGSGRTSLLQLIAGEVHPAEGVVRTDGQDLRRVDVRGARAQVALMPQVPFVVRGPLLDNLTLFNPELTDEALRYAALLGLDEVASGLAQGWHTPVGFGGAPLSRGAVQRLGLARALALRPKVLLLDDVTAHLDAEGDARLCAVLDTLRGKTTVVMTSHRRSVLSHMDRVLVLARGRLEVWE